METEPSDLKRILKKQKNIFQGLTPNEKRAVSGFVSAIIISVLVLIFQGNIGERPGFGGDFKEGVVGSPRHINPILAPNNEPDLDLTELIFASLINDLTSDYEISDDKKSYTLNLKKDILWHDGQPFTAKDVIFTIQTIQDPAFLSPLRFNFLGVGVEATDKHTVKFNLKDVYAPFKTTLDIGILPEHIWRNVAPSGFALAEANTRPIGNGPYVFKKLSKEKNGFISSVELEARNEKSAFIQKIELRFYPNEEKMIEAYEKREIDNIKFISPQYLKRAEDSKLNLITLDLPRYFALFFNTERIKKTSVRQKLAGALDRDFIIKEILLNYGRPFGKDYPKTADQTVAEKFSLVTADIPELEKTALLVKDQWEALGAEIELRVVPSEKIQTEKIRPRDYDILLFGEVLGNDPDPFAFWHSSQKNDPGLNLSLYDSPKADRLLVEARQEFDSKKRALVYEEFYDLLNKDAPAIFLYSPDYLYGLNKKIKGANLSAIAIPSKRFADIENWYIKTKK